MAPFPAWFDEFCDLRSNRLEILVQTLGQAAIPFDLVQTGAHRHVQVRYGKPSIPQPGEKVLLAHYDRVPGTPGANDNGASVLALVDYLSKPRNGTPLRVLFTDGEELSPGTAPADQGAHGLALRWGPVSDLFPVVFDMTGIGDTVVLGHLGEHLIRKVRGAASPVNLDSYARVRMGAKRWLATCGAGDTVEIDTPFSDDLGLFLAGVPAVQISLLPRKEALSFRQKTSALPPSWATMHTSDDVVEGLWPQSRVLVQELLRKLETFPV